MHDSPLARAIVNGSLSVALLWGAWGLTPAGLEYEALHRALPDGSYPEELLPDDVAEGRGRLAVSRTGLGVYWLGGEFDGGIGFFPYLRRSGYQGENVQDVLAIVAIGDITFGEFGNLYYTLNSDCVPCGEIRRKHGENTEVLFPAGYPTAIAYDPTGEVVCWADFDSDDWVEDAIVCGTVGEPAGETILLTTAKALAIDSLNQKIYWTGEGMVRRANLDGSNPEILVDGLASPHGIAVDPARNRMFWTDRVAGTIQRADLDGSNVQDLLTGLVAPTALEFYDNNGPQTGEPVNWIYWLSVTSGDVPATTGWGVGVLIVAVLAGTALLLRRRRFSSGA